MSTQKRKEVCEADIASMVASNILDGSDTTAISLRVVIYHLLRNPERLKRILEIGTLWKENKISNTATFEQSKGMPYLQVAIQEALHCHPAVGMSLPQVTPPGGIEISGRFIPQGVRIFVRSMTFLGVPAYTKVLRSSLEPTPGLYIGIQRPSGRMLKFSDPTDGSREMLENMSMT